MNAENPADVIEAAAKAYREIWLDDVPGIPWDSLGRTAKAAYVDSMRRFAEDGWLADPADRDARFTEAVAKVTPCTCSAQRSRAERAEAELARLHSWEGLLELLDEHWPEDIFPTLPDDQSRDPGPRIVSLIRWVAELRATIDRVRRETAMDWAGYFRTADSAVGWPTLTIARVIELLESGHEPFGCSAALDGGGQQ